jgi:AcrR family transcriptional regulator
MASGQKKRVSTTNGVDEAPLNPAKISLLNAAEALFAEREFDSVSTRDIAGKAKVNLALVHYYFGSKQKLFRAVLARRIEELSRRRLELLDIHGRQSQTVPVAQIAEAFVLPMLEFATGGSRGWRNYIRLNGRVASSDKYIKLAGDLYDPAAEVFIKEIARAFHAVTRRDVEWGYLFMVTVMSCAFAGGGRIERLSDGHAKSSDLREAYDALIPFISAGLAATCQRTQSPH